MSLTHLTVRGAREHNLKGFDVALPRDKLIVITGLSGSGKSSLAFDTIYAEGQRRYVESLSAYARQFLEMMQKPDVEHIDGLSPAISIEQKTTSRNPRSTVATVTEIYDYMRLLWARVGVPYSPATGLPIEAQTVSTMVDRVMALPEGTRLYLLAPVVRGRKGEYRKELAEWQKAGFTRVRIDGEIYGIEDAPALDKKFKHDIEVVVDRIAVKEGIETRLADSFEQALKLADGLAYVDLADGTVADLPTPNPSRKREGSETYGDAGEVSRSGVGRPTGNLKGAGLPANRIVFSEKFACPVSGFTIEEIEPRLFSFNAPQGACPGCDGLGEKLLFDPQLVVPNEALTLKQGAVVPWAKSNPPSPYYMQVLESLAAAYDFDLTTPWNELEPDQRMIILHGTGGMPVALTFKDGRKSYTVNKAFEGVIGNLNRRMLQTDSAWMREELSKFQTSQPCETCNGKRLKPEALSVKVGGEDISSVAWTSKPIVAGGLHVVVVGGGDTASDCVGTAFRQGAVRVTQLDIRPQPPEKEDKLMVWPYWATKMRTSSSQAEGADREFQVATLEFVGEDGQLTGVRCCEVDEKRKPIPDTDFVIRADLAFIAIGFAGPVSSGVLSELKDELKTATDTRRSINVSADEKSYRTSVDRLYAAGDVRRGQSLVVWAIREGRQAARSIDLDLMGATVLPR